MLNLNQVMSIARRCLLLLVCWVAMPSSACDGGDKECVPVGSWEFSIGIGYGARSNPIVESDDISIYLLPSINFYGERFFWATDTMGYTLLDSKRHMFNIIGTVSYDQAYFNEWGVGNFSIEGGNGDGVSASRVESNYQDRVQNEGNLTGSWPLSGWDEEDCDVVYWSDRTCGYPHQGAIDLDRLHDRDMAGLAGFEYSYDFKRLRLGMQVLQDVTKVHHGKQLRFALSMPVFEAPNATMVFAGAEWKDAKTLDYYYGVRENEVNDPIHAYHVGSDLSYYVKLDWRRPVSEKWELRAVAHYRYFGSKIYESPLVEEHASSTIFLGGVYHF